jgi:hypothetical protein
MIPTSVVQQLTTSIVHPLGCVSQKGKFRTITDMTVSGLNPEINTSQYGNVEYDAVSQLISDISQWPFDYEIIVMCEDVNAFYRQFLVRLCEQALQLTSIKGQLAIDHVECFGSKSAPAKTTQFVDVVCWISFKLYGINLRHYVDNIYWITALKTPDIQSRISINPLLLQEARRQQSLICNLFQQLGLPLNSHDRQMGHIVKLLGFQIDTIARTISIPEETQQQILDLINPIMTSGTCTLKQMLTVNGKLVWACAAIPIGMSLASIIWSFVTQQSKISNCTSKSVRLPPLTITALQWFQRTLTSFCGISYFQSKSFMTINQSLELHNGELPYTSDSSHLGGAFRTPHHYSFWLWCPHCYNATKNDITTFELASILLGLNSDIGRLSASRNLIWYTDSQAACQSFVKGYCDSPHASAIILEIKTATVVFQHASFRLHWSPRVHLKSVDSITRGCDKDFMLHPANSSLTLLPARECHSLIVTSRTGHCLTFGLSALHPQ